MQNNDFLFQLDLNTAQVEYLAMLNIHESALNLFIYLLPSWQIWISGSETEDSGHEARSLI